MTAQACHANSNSSNFYFPFKVPQICLLILGAVMSEPKTPTPTPAGDTYKGWVFKWTNYIKGYQRRWFVLSNGLLSYYRYAPIKQMDLMKDIALIMAPEKSLSIKLLQLLFNYTQPVVN